MPEENNLKKTLQLTFIFSIACSAGAFLIQSRANISTNACSYLDPITIDIVAILFGLFLLIEGLHDVFRHRLCHIREQWTKSFRIGIGCSILIIHIMQFFHKNL
ncbi:MAG TPA: hypothetical protein PLB05_02140 [Candidatus Omnitrophota bacterium]|jgi:hypothetical protein|nr:hypothetical protein [Candidatus Omnitrophota bacterium]HPN56923.1 hypothetical protein [Candidatus Omnitrophota bacterium]